MIFISKSNTSETKEILHNRWQKCGDLSQQDMTNKNPILWDDFLDKANEITSVFVKLPLHQVSQKNVSTVSNTAQDYIYNQFVTFLFHYLTKTSN